ncbi:ring finger domain containing protein [Nitzschia inconspicua]|uniref:Ring finger domain containing protein n=1 Tax=Nitzschia inconspicua TaxID=303405 RepID=A0A9K3PVD5_9STRA|nr:ring finger domain containing protein [Nitzschia inconspicua]KAG7361033.1 ring finger domain containing protein [Nitzschia inconspicua]
MDLPFPLQQTSTATTASSSTTTTAAATTARSSASITSSARYFDPEEFFAMSSPNVRLRRSSRTAIVNNSRSASVPIVASPTAAHTRATVAASASRSFTHSIFSTEAANASSTSTSSRSSTRAARKRKHHVESEISEGQEASNCSPPFPPPAKRRRCCTNNSQTTTTTGSKKQRSISAKKPPAASMLKAPPPTVTKNDDQKPAAVENCCICMCDVKPEDVSQINGCDHHFCFGCIEKWAERENSCPLCKSRFTKIERVNKKRQKGVKNTKKVRQRDQRSDLMPGAAIEGLLASLSASRTIGGSAGLARIIFGVSGPGTGPFGNNTMAGHPASFGLLDSSDEDDEHPFSLLRFGGPSAGIRISAFTAGASPTHPAASFSIRYARLPHHTPPPPPPPQERARSHATNGNDATAGNRNNPLEINSDTDDEDSVQILDFD